MPISLEALPTDPLPPLTQEALWEHLLTQRKFRSKRQVVVVNATLGEVMFTGFIDFLQRWQHHDPNLQITVVSYFSEIYELGRGLRDRGVTTLDVQRFEACTLRELNLVDLFLFIGPSEPLGRLLTMEGLTAKLVLLDLAFYHRVLAVSEGKKLRHVRFVEPEAPVNPIVAYSTQTRWKAVTDLWRMGFELPARYWTWRWFPYIPAAVHLRPVFRPVARQFDVLFLGASNRDYGLIDPADLEGLRILFLGSLEPAEWLRANFGHLDLTCIEKLPKADYQRVLAASGCAVLPFDWDRENCFLSIQDPLVAGTPVITTRHKGVDRLFTTGAPLFAFERHTFARILRRILSPDFDRAAHFERSRRYCVEHLDVGRMMFRILDEQLQPEVLPLTAESPCPSSS